MELKKGDVVAVVAEVVAERDGKIIISIPGATVSDDLIIAPRKPIRILDRAPSPGDQVLYKGETRCIFRKHETETVISLVKEGMPHDDPSSYLFANIRDVRRIDQAGTVKFVAIDKPVPHAETGREIMEEVASEEKQAVLLPAPEVEPEITKYDFTEESSSSGEVEASDASGQDKAGLLVEESVSKEVEQISQEDSTSDEDTAEGKAAADLDDADGEDGEDESDKISIEMPEGFTAPALTRENKSEKEIKPEGAAEEEVHSEGEKADSDNASNATFNDEVSIAEESENAPDESENLTGDKEDRPAEEPVDLKPEMSEEERHQKEQRLENLRRQTIENLTDGEGETKGSANSILDDIEDLDND